MSRSRYRRVRCDNCNPVAIQGIVCHEEGCPTPWRGANSVRECKNCPRKFTPNTELRWHSGMCSVGCYRDYWHLGARAKVQFT